MALAKRYSPEQAEPALQAAWQAQGTDPFDREASEPIYSIDTPPPPI